MIAHGFRELEYLHGVAGFVTIGSELAPKVFAAHVWIYHQGF